MGTRHELFGRDKKFSGANRVPGWSFQYPDRCKCSLVWLDSGIEASVVGQESKSYERPDLFAWYLNSYPYISSQGGCAAVSVDS